MIDIILLAIIALGVVRGFLRGLVRQLASLVGLVAGLLIARALYASVGEYLSVQIGTSVKVSQVIAFFLIWIAVPLLLSVVAFLLTKALQIIQLGFLNRLLGALLGGLKYALVLSLMLQFLTFIDKEGEIIPDKTKKDSKFYDRIENFTDIFIPIVDNLDKSEDNSSLFTLHSSLS